jgi:polyvinyl alcohol dehydrogenase (cytochrome)
MNNVGFDGPLVTRSVVVFGDLGGNIYGLDATTGTQLWTIHPTANSSVVDTGIFGSAVQVGKYVAIGVASNEENGVPADYQYTADGSMVLLDPTPGQIQWQTATIPAADYAAGWRGASSWSTPTYDQHSNLLYFSTGNYFTKGTSADPGAEDAVFALNATTGQVVWHTQLVHNDPGKRGRRPRGRSPLHRRWLRGAGRLRPGRGRDETR